MSAGEICACIIKKCPCRALMYHAKGYKVNQRERKGKILSWRASLGLLVAFGRSVRPTGQSVRKIADIASRGTQGFAEVTGGRLVATVVTSGGSVRVVVVVQVCRKAIATCGALNTILDHVEDGLIGVVRVVLGSVVRLHQAWVVDATVGSC